MHRPVRTSLLAATALAAIAMSLVTIASYVWPLCVNIPANDRNWLIAHWYDGRMRIFWIQSAKRPITVQHQLVSSGPRLVFQFEGPFDESRVPYILPQFRIGPVFESAVLIGSRRTVSAFGFFWPWQGFRRPAGVSKLTLRFVRFPFWLPAGILVVFSVEGMRRGPMRRRHRLRRGLCLGCGYDLRGLPEPRCPECGASIAPDQCQAFGTGDEDAT